MVDEYKEYFQEALRYTLEKKGYGAQSFYAKKAGVNQQYISSILSGNRQGSEKTRRKIAEAAGFTYEDFLRLGESIVNKGHSETGLLFIEAVRHLFRHSGFESQKALAYTAGVTPGTINDILKGRRAFGQKTQEKIAAAFDRDLIDLLAVGQDLQKDKKAKPKKLSVISGGKISTKGRTHEEIITLFKHKDWARKLNALLLVIEEDEDKRKVAEGVIESLAEQVLAKKKKRKRSNES